MKREVLDFADESGLDSIEEFQLYGKCLRFTNIKPVKKFRKERDEFVKKSKQRKPSISYAFAI